MAEMFNPPHPGSILKEDVLPALKLSVGEAAGQLGVSRVQFSRVINGHAAITADLAYRLEQWLTGPSASVWRGMQSDYELWQLKHSGHAPHVEPAPELACVL